ncbi:MAG: SpoIIE family protein phosphatase [Spirochaetota bacterium]
MKIRHKILIIILIVIAISIGIMAYIISISKDALLNQMQENTALMSESYADELNNRIINYEKTVKNIASQIKTAINIEDVLIEQHKLYPEFSYLFYTDIDTGNIINMEPYDNEIAKTSFKNKDFWKKSIVNSELNTTVNQDFGYPALVFSTPVKIDFSYGESTIQGIITIIIPLNKFFDKINEIVIGETGNILVIDENGYFLNNNNTVLNKKLSDISQDSISEEIENFMIMGKTGNGVFKKEQDYYFITFSPIKHLNWSLAINSPLNEHTAEIDELIITMIIILILFVIITLIGVYLMVHFIMRPVKELTGSIRELEKGNMNVRSKVLTKDEIGTLGKTFNKMADQLQESFNKINDYNEHLEDMVKYRTSELNEANKELKEINRAMLEELKMAQRIQENIIPDNTNLPHSGLLKYASDYTAMENIGGDLYDVIRIGKNCCGLLIADVSGHGVPAALITTMAKVSFNTNSIWGMDTGEICTKINEELYNFIGDLEYYLTAYYGIIDLETGIFKYTNCAHHPAILYKKKSKEFIKLDTDGFFIGAFADGNYKTGEVQLEEGDRILLFTDGIIEARNEKNEFYEYKRLMEYLNKNSDKDPEDFVNGLIEDVDNFCNHLPADDDRAILYIEFVSKVTDEVPAEESIKIKAKLEREEQLEDETISESEYKKSKEEFKKLYAESIKYIKNKQFKKAMELLKKLENMKPSSASILNNLSICYYKLNELKKASEILNQAIKMDKNNEKIKNNKKIIDKILSTDNNN